MLPPPLFSIRKECPPGSCECGREQVLSDPAADARILRLTRDEEKKLIARIETISSFADLKHIEERLLALLGVVLSITPGTREVRTVRGLRIQLEALPGLCRKTQATIPAAVRRCLEKNPHIVFAILDAHGLLRAE